MSRRPACSAANRDTIAELPSISLEIDELGSKQPVGVAALAPFNFWYDSGQDLGQFSIEFRRLSTSLSMADHALAAAVFGLKLTAAAGRQAGVGKTQVGKPWPRCYSASHPASVLRGWTSTARSIVELYRQIFISRHGSAGPQDTAELERSVRRGFLISGRCQISLTEKGFRLCC
jgi:hypothetical protein